MFLRKLRAVGYARAEEFSVESESALRHLVVYLEDHIFHTQLPNVIRALKLVDNPQWDQVLMMYLGECQCDLEFPAQKRQIVDWLLRSAITILTQAHQPHLDKIKQPQAPTTHQPPWAALDWSGAEVGEAVCRLANLLQIPPHSDHFLRLSASAAVLLHANINTKDSGHEGNACKSWTLASINWGLQVEDVALWDGCKILRMLHVANLRGLQTEMDVALVVGQQLTANPTTDQQLGQVGF